MITTKSEFSNFACPSVALFVIGRIIFFVKSMILRCYTRKALLSLSSFETLMLVTCILQELEFALQIFNFFFTSVFILEAAVKIIALGLMRYLSDRSVLVLLASIPSTDCSYRHRTVAWSVCLLLTTACPAKAAESMDNVIWDEDSRGSKKHCVRWRCTLTPSGE